MKKFFSLLTLALLSPTLTFAANINKVEGNIIEGPEGVLDFINSISNWVFAALLTISVLFILLAAYNYLTGSSGEGVEKAHKMITYAAVAIAIAVLSKGIVYVAAKLAGQQVIKI